MNKETRVQKIAHIIETSKPYGRQDILWHGKLLPMDVYEIPLECLIYNKYNGRILSRTKTLEKQGRITDPETEEGKKILEDLLWDSKEARNEITKRDIEEKGQLKVGIVTRDGIVIDGNRRVMLLNRIKKSHFNAIVLPVALEDDPIEVEKLETTYQMGEDEKLGYNPIEKYLKAKQIYKKLREQFSHEKSIEQIADWMGEEATVIEEWLDVVNVIDEYLEYLKYDGIYAMADTPNDGKEDLFLFLKKWLKTFYNKESSKAFDNYTPSDVDDLKIICFDYIRAKIGESYDGKQFRIIADGQKDKHFFGSKAIWNNFRDEHFKAAVPALEKIDSNYPINIASENIEASLSNRDSKFRDEVLDALIGNLRKHTTDIRYAQAANRPSELVEDAQKAIDAIDQGHKAFSSPDVLEQIEGLIQKLLNMLKKKSPDRTLSTITQLLGSVKLDANVSDKDKDAMHAKLKEIQRIAYQLEKSI
jgi:hypothetical protein